MQIRLINIKALTALAILFSSGVLASAESDYEAGVESYKAGNNETAAMHFESALQQGMNSVSLQFNLASTYYRLGRYEDAKYHFNMLNQTEEMRDIADYHLGLIAIEQQELDQARLHFDNVVRSDKDKKLSALSSKHLSSLTRKEDRWKVLVSGNLGHDDNISSVAGDSVLEIADTFYDLFASTDLLISGKRKHGWVADAYIYDIDYRDSDDHDMEQYALGIKRSLQIDDWESSAHLNLAKSSYGGDDLQTITRLDVKAQNSLSGSERITLRYRAEDIQSDNSLYDYLEGWRQRADITYLVFSGNNIKQIQYELELNDRKELVTTDFTYDYSPTRHTLSGKYTQIIDRRWWLSADLSYRLSDYPVSPSIDRSDDQWRLTLSADHHFDRTFKLATQFQYTDNSSTEDRYSYDKSIIKIGLSKLF